MPKKIKVLLVKPNERPEPVEIDDELEAMQNLVGGLIEEICPFEDDVILICNEEGKLNGLPLNRAIYDEHTGVMLDIIAGNFFIVKAPFDSDEMESLNDEEIEKYTKLYAKPEMFTRVNGRIIASVYDV